MNRKWLVRSLPVLGLGLAVWLIVKYVKPEVYDIKVPEKWATEELSPEMHIKKDGILSFGHTGYDSITASSEMRVIHSDTGVRSFYPVTGALPLQWLGFWKGGYRYVQPVVVRTRPDSWKMEMTEPFTLGFWDPVSPGLFKETYEAGEIILRSEKEKPLKIMALWEKFMISGETNGEQVKIRIPACAANVQFSIIRVWACDKITVSPVCEIPLYKGEVALRHKQIERFDQRDFQKRTMDVLKFGYGVTDSVVLHKVEQSLAKAAADSEVALCLSYGDIRFNENSMICNYFGKKAVLLFNAKQVPAKIKIPMKGEFRNSISGRNFDVSRGKLELELQPGEVDVIF